MDVKFERITPDHTMMARTIIARAFANDPLIEWLSPSGDYQADERLDLIALFYAPSVEAYALARTGHVALVHNTVVGVSLWGNSTIQARASTATKLLPTGSGTTKLLLGKKAALLGAGIRTARGADPLLNSPYLHELTVLDDMRGKGIGTQLLSTGLAAFGDHGAWLETANGRKYSDYERAGFRVTHAGPVGESGVTMTRMVFDKE
ncbi:GNAT family N-acetyltransferase [Flaviflexus massiliensis]|uniref:GNAT family N-acetyltransferase n=1 Tax=Flaviflexus massiliensis TaxID=1522309 RepID=UPI0006D56459|nr:GNAT family N-acetyltransferase [Flaviflexus massiliensis]